MNEIYDSKCPLCDNDADYRFCDGGKVKLYTCTKCWEFLISTSAERRLKKEKDRKAHFSKIASMQKGTDSLLQLSLTVPAKIVPAIVPRTKYRL